MSPSPNNHKTDVAAGPARTLSEKALRRLDPIYKSGTGVEPIRPYRATIKEVFDAVRRRAATIAPETEIYTPDTQYIFTKFTDNRYTSVFMDGDTAVASIDPGPKGGAEPAVIVASTRSPDVRDVTPYLCQSSGDRVGATKLEAFYSVLNVTMAFSPGEDIVVETAALLNRINTNNMRDTIKNIKRLGASPFGQTILKGLPVKDILPFIERRVFLVEDRYWGPTHFIEIGLHKKANPAVLRQFYMAYGRPPMSTKETNGLVETVETPLFKEPCPINVPIKSEDTTLMFRKNGDVVSFVDKWGDACIDRFIIEKLAMFAPHERMPVLRLLAADEQFSVKNLVRTWVGYGAPSLRAIETVVSMAKRSGACQQYGAEEDVWIDPDNPTRMQVSFSNKSARWGGVILLDANEKEFMGYVLSIGRLPTQKQADTFEKNLVAGKNQNVMTR